MRLFKTKAFARYARGEKITDKSLREAIVRAEKGLVDADLGGGLIKQRVARPGQGRSGGFRVIVAFRVAKRSVFLLGFAKNERDNIDDDELATLKDLAAAWLTADDKAIEKAMAAGVLVEVRDEE